ncbi:MAG: hypothetical protein R3C68_05100 [Myxococcota bacterium]
MEQDVQDLRTFFGFDIDAPYRIFLAKDHDQFDAIRGKKVDWAHTKKNIVGSAMSATEQVILNPALWSDLSRTYIDLNSLIKHEMAHGYVSWLVGNSSEFTVDPYCIKPATEVGTRHYWLDEGIATLASGQLDDWKRYLSSDFDTHKSFAATPSYTALATVIEFLIQKFGKQRLFEVISQLPPTYSAKNDPAIFSL